MKSLLFLILIGSSTIAFADTGANVNRLIQKGEGLIQLVHRGHLSSRDQMIVEDGLNDVYSKLALALRNPPPNTLDAIVAELNRVEAAMDDLNGD